MRPIARAVIALRPGVDFADTDGTLAGIRWDTPGVTPPTQAEVDAEIARQANPVPPTVTSGSFIRAAHELDWLDGIEASVAAIGQQNSLVPLLWVRASQFERNHPFVAAVAQAMGKTREEVDELFRRAGGYD